MRQELVNKGIQHKDKMRKLKMHVGLYDERRNGVTFGTCSAEVINLSPTASHKGTRTT